jgi:hypothetical protein
MHPRSSSRRHPDSTGHVGDRSDLGLQLFLSALFTSLFAAMAVVMALWAARARPGDVLGPGAAIALGALCGLLALFASIDLWTATRNRHRDR